MPEPEASDAAQSPELRRAECAGCGGVRNCSVEGHFQERGGDGMVDWATDWFILRCRGCDHVFMQTVGTFSEDYDQYDDEHGDFRTVYNETVRYWPAVSARKKPSWMAEGSGVAFKDERLNAALLEVYGALDGDLRALAAIGIRTAFDVAAEILAIDPEAPFTVKLDTLVEQGHIGKVDRDRLESLIEAGSASAHRGWRPTKKALDVMMDVLEHFINEAFVAPAQRARLDADAKEMRAGVPKRRPRKKNTEAAG